MLLSLLLGVTACGGSTGPTVVPVAYRVIVGALVPPANATTCYVVVALYDVNHSDLGTDVPVASGTLEAPATPDDLTARDTLLIQVQPGQYNALAQTTWLPPGDNLFQPFAATVPGSHEVLC